MQKNGPGQILFQNVTDICPQPACMRHAHTFWSKHLAYARPKAVTPMNRFENDDLEHLIMHGHKRLWRHRILIVQYNERSIFGICKFKLPCAENSVWQNIMVSMMRFFLPLHDYGVSVQRRGRQNHTQPRKPPKATQPHRAKVQTA